MIFLDTNFIISLFLKKHDNHDRATEIWRNIQNEDKIISRLTIAEVLNVLNIRVKANIELTEKVCKFMFDELIIINDIDYYIKAMKHLKLYYPERIAFFDCIYMVLMEELGIKEIATFDEDFDLNKNIKRIH